jgi:Stress responsive A/B Barrel Domain
MIRHIVLFKLKPGLTWDDPRVEAAEEMAGEVGRKVPSLRDWYVGRNFSTRPVAYDFVVIGLLDDEAGLEEYLVDPFHVAAIERWREVSDWVIADVVEQPVGIGADNGDDGSGSVGVGSVGFGGGASRLEFGRTGPA